MTLVCNLKAGGINPSSTRSRGELCWIVLEARITLIWLTINATWGYPKVGVFHVITEMMNHRDGNKHTNASRNKTASFLQCPPLDALQHSAGNLAYLYIPSESAKMDRAYRGHRAWSSPFPRSYPRYEQWRTVIALQYPSQGKSACEKLDLFLHVFRMGRYKVIQILH